MPQTEVANLVQAFWQHVLQEPAHELVPRQARVNPAAGGPLLVADSDASVVEVVDAVVGDGNAVDVARDILEHGFGTVAPGRAMHDPGLPPGGLGDGWS